MLQLSLKHEHANSSVTTKYKRTPTDTIKILLLENAKIYLPYLTKSHNYLIIF